MLREHPIVDSDSVRVRLVRLGVGSLDVDIFAYIFTREWNDFLTIQEELLLGIIDVVQKAGTGIAFPTQRLYLADTSEKLSEISDYAKRRKATFH